MAAPERGKSLRPPSIFIASRIAVRLAEQNPFTPLINFKLATSVANSEACVTREQIETLPSSSSRCRQPTFHHYRHCLHKGNADRKRTTIRW